MLKNGSVGQKCHDPGSNRGHLDLQSNALPTELFRPTNDTGLNYGQTPVSNI